MKDWLEISKRLQSIAQAGLTYGNDKYDLERYEMLRDISIEILEKHTDESSEKIRDLFAFEKGYQTPKVDIRGVVFKDDKILMVKEVLDGKWSLPGGWADIGDTPKEVVEREVKEEAGMFVKATKLLAVLDKSCHEHPADIYHIYKMFFLCEDLNKTVPLGIETSEIGYFSLDNLPDLSLGRITKGQIALLYEFLEHPEKEAIFD